MTKLTDSEVDAGVFSCVLVILFVVIIGILIYTLIFGAPA